MDRERLDSQTSQLVRRVRSNHARKRVKRPTRLRDLTSYLSTAFAKVGDTHTSFLDLNSVRNTQPLRERQHAFCRGYSVGVSVAVATTRSEACRQYGTQDSGSTHRRKHPAAGSR